MTPKEQRIALAEACGWKRWQDEESGILGGDWSKFIWTPPGNHHTAHAKLEPPDYLNDLNAMAEAEKTLAYLPDYLFHLREVCGPFPDAECEWNDIWWSDVVRATAPQRAEAFLRTLNLWKD